MKIIVYTANIGGYDNFNHHNILDLNVRYILFTDNKYISSPSWEISHIDFIKEKLDNRKIARYIKTNPHKILPAHDVSIWVDHCYIPKIKNFEDFLNQISFLNKNVMCYNHNERNCSYKEANVCKSKNLDNHTVIDNQINGYITEKFPNNYGLFDTGFMIRKNNEIVNNFNEFWWNEIKHKSGRDQLSQMYSSWKTKTQINPIPIGRSIYHNPFLNKKIPHN